MLTSSLTFSAESLKFLQLAGEQHEPDWLEKNDGQYQQLVRLPLLALADRLKNELAIDAVGYHFPTKGLGRIKRASNKVALDGTQYKDWVSYIATRPANTRFEKNPLLFFGLLPNDPQWHGVVVAGGLYTATSQQTRRVRLAIADDSEPFKRLFADKDFKKSFKSGFEAMVKAPKCPRGFNGDHPDIEWIKLKTFFVCKTLTNQEFSSKDLAKNLARDFTQLLRLNGMLQKAIDGNWSD